jgi:hypothetical protein
VVVKVVASDYTVHALRLFTDRCSNGTACAQRVRGVDVAIAHPRLEIRRIYRLPADGVTVFQQQQTESS